MYAAASKQPVVLASVSPRRAQLLQQLDIAFTVVPSNATEILHEELTAREVAQLNAYRKARYVAKHLPDALVIGADTVVALETRLFGKPDNTEHSCRMLEELQGQRHIVVTGVCLICLRQHRQLAFSETTLVTFLPLDGDKIRKYVTHVHTLDKAGAYAIQEHGDWIIDKVEGSYSNVVGLPLERLKLELDRWNKPRPVQQLSAGVYAQSKPMLSSTQPRSRL